MDVIGSFRTFYKRAATKKLLDNTNTIHYSLLVNSLILTRYFSPFTRYFLPYSHDYYFFTYIDNFHLLQRHTLLFTRYSEFFLDTRYLLYF